MIRNKLISMKECVNGLIFRFIVVSMLRKRRERRIIVYVMIIVLFRLYIRGHYDYGLITAFAEEINKEEQPKEVGMFTWWQKILIISSIVVAISLAIKWGISVEERLSKIDKIPTLTQTATTMNTIRGEIVDNVNTIREEIVGNVNTIREEIVDNVSVFEEKITEVINSQSDIVVKSLNNFEHIDRDLDVLNQILDEHATIITKHNQMLAKMK